MPDPSHLFRREALEHRATDHLRSDPLRLGSRWARRAPLGLLGILGVATAAGLTVHVDDRASGTAVVGGDGSAVSALLPATARARLATGGPLDVELADGRRLSVRIPGGGVEAIDADAAARRFGRNRVAGLLATATALIAVEGPLPEALPAAERGTGRASVRLGSAALLPMLLSGLFAGGAAP